MTKRILSASGVGPIKAPGEPRLDDESSELWDPAHQGVARELLDAAVQCFATDGYHATTTRDISTRAGLSPAAMYVHFSSKELLLYEIVRSAHVHALDEVRQPLIEAAPTAAQALSLLMHRYTAWHARHHIAARVAQYELSGLEPDHYEQILELRHATNAVFRSVVGRGVDDGSFAKVDAVPVARAMLSLSIDLVRWYRLDDGDSPDQLGALYAQLALSMVQGSRDPSR